MGIVFESAGLVLSKAIARLRIASDGWGPHRGRGVGSTRGVEGERPQNADWAAWARRVSGLAGRRQARTSRIWNSQHPSASRRIQAQHPYPQLHWRKIRSEDHPSAAADGTTLVFMPALRQAKGGFLSVLR